MFANIAPAEHLLSSTHNSVENKFHGSLMYGIRFGLGYIDHPRATAERISRVIFVRVGPMWVVFALIKLFSNKKKKNNYC